MSVQAENLPGPSARTQAEPEPDGTGIGPVELIRVDSVKVEGTPRTTGEDPKHLESLAASDSELPPIVVHRQTMCVIDGVHRLRVARMREQEYIKGRFFDGSDADAFVIAVKSNVAHGLPLSLLDRTAAAARILTSHPQWSNRMIASVTGISATTVAEIRNRLGGDGPQAEPRIGQDGRVRPVNGVERRKLAFELLTNHPELSLRQIAKAAGVSPETVRDVRNRTLKGEHPVPDQRQRARNGPAAAAQSRRPAETPRAEQIAAQIAAQSEILRRLTADPALKHTDTGRMLLRMLHTQTVDLAELEKIINNVPTHCATLVVRVAQDCARMWNYLAERVEKNVVSQAPSDPPMPPARTT